MRNDLAMELSKEILEDIELKKYSLQDIALKCLRLARLTNDANNMKWLRFEVYGYTTIMDINITRDNCDLLFKPAADLISPEMLKSIVKSGRYYVVNEQSGNPQIRYFSDSINILEKLIIDVQDLLKQPISINNYNENQILLKNSMRIVEKIRLRLYEYALNTYYELSFGNVMEDIFVHRRDFVDRKLKDICPEALKEFLSVYDDIKSKNGADWAKAVHSCRRIFKEVADKVFPPSNDIKENDKKICLDDEHYKNRLIQYIKSKSSSDKYADVVGSQLEFIINRIESLYEASCKGTHGKVSLDEAERYIIYTYLLIGDVLSL